jgi:hypothetical protein
VSSGAVCLSVFVSLSLAFCLFVFVSASLSLSLTVSLLLSLPVTLFLSLSLLESVSLCLSLSLSLYVSVSLCLSVAVSASLSLSLTVALNFSVSLSLSHSRCSGKDEPEGCRSCFESKGRVVLPVDWRRPLDRRWHPGWDPGSKVCLLCLMFSCLLCLTTLPNAKGEALLAGNYFKYV